MTQRSADYICGVPFNIASYALLIHLMCNVINNDETYSGCKFTPGRLIMNFGDTHIYEEHKQSAIKQLLRTPYHFPEINIKKNMKEITDVSYEDIEMVNYISYPILSVKMIA
jgi:thymidylate synthase